MAQGEAELRALRSAINSATATLAFSLLCNEEATQMLCSVMTMQARRANAAIPSSNPVIINQADADDDNGISSSGHSNRSSCKCLPIAALAIDQTISETKKSLIFPYPFLVKPLPAQFVSEKPQECLASLCAVGLYNLGLARHIQSFLVQGLDNGNFKQAFLQQAYQYYFQARTLLTDSVMGHYTDMDSSFVQLYLALHNNMAEVCQALELESIVVQGLQSEFSAFLLAIPEAHDSIVYQHFCRVSQSYGYDIEQTLQSMSSI